jgi:hypothetical protein
MTFRHAARHLSVRGRLARRRMRSVLATVNAPAIVGTTSFVFGALSVASHIAATVGMLALATPPLPDANNDPLVQTRFLYPLMKKLPRPVEERVRFVGVSGTHETPATREQRQVAPRGDLVEQVVGVVATVAAEESPPVDVFTEVEVDITAARDPDSDGPAYPPDLLERKVEGAARCQFVVDSTGHPDEGSFTVLAANHASFGEAVRAALPRMKYRPAMIGPKRVAQLVEQTFMFRITPAALVP